MKTKPNEPISPFFKWNEPGYGDTITICDSSGSKQFLPYKQGLTKREYFAAMAMQGLIAGAEYAVPLIELAEQSVEIADALINELNKEDYENNKTKL